MFIAPFARRSWWFSNLASRPHRAQDEKSAKDEKEDIKGSFDLDMLTQIHREQGTGQKITLYLAGAVKAEKLEVSAAVVLQKDAALLCV